MNFPVSITYWVATDCSGLGALTNAATSLFGCHVGHCETALTPDANVTPDASVAALLTDVGDSTDACCHGGLSMFGASSDGALFSDIGVGNWTAPETTGTVCR